MHEKDIPTNRELRWSYIQTQQEFPHSPYKVISDMMVDSYLVHRCMPCGQNSFISGAWNGIPIMRSFQRIHRKTDLGSYWGQTLKAMLPE
jgi:hypothetical protein